MDLHASSWICMHSGTFCINSETFCINSGTFCMHCGTFCMHSGIFCMHSVTFCMHSGTFFNNLHAFWNILHAFWYILDQLTTDRLTDWHTDIRTCWAASSQLKMPSFGFTSLLGGNQRYTGFIVGVWGLGTMECPFFYVLSILVYTQSLNSIACMLYTR